MNNKIFSFSYKTDKFLSYFLVFYFALDFVTEKQGLKPLPSAFIWFYKIRNFCILINLSFTHSQH